MTEKPKNLLEILDEILSKNPNSREMAAREVELVALNVINEGVDKDLMEKILKCANGYNTGALFSTLAFALAHELYTNTASERELCAVTQTYADFIHQAGHALWEKHGNPHKKTIGDATH